MISGQQRSKLFLNPIEEAARGYTDIFDTAIFQGFSVNRKLFELYQEAILALKEDGTFDTFLQLASGKMALPVSPSNVVSSAIAPTASVMCDQTYILGQSLGGSVVATFFRLEYGFGRLLTASSPNMFASYSYPREVLGDSFYLAEDAIRAFPAGYQLKGVRVHEFCFVSQGASQAPAIETIISSFVNHANLCQFFNIKASSGEGYDVQFAASYRDFFSRGRFFGNSTKGIQTDHSMCSSKPPPKIEECRSVLCPTSTSRQLTQSRQLAEFCSYGSSALQSIAARLNAAEMSWERKYASCPIGV